MSNLRQRQMDSLRKNSEPGATADDAEATTRKLDKRGSDAQRAYDAAERERYRKPTP